MDEYVAQSPEEFERLFSILDRMTGIPLLDERRWAYAGIHDTVRSAQGSGLVTRILGRQASEGLLTYEIATADGMRTADATEVERIERADIPLSAYVDDLVRTQTGGERRVIEVTMRGARPSYVLGPQLPQRFFARKTIRAKEVELVERFFRNDGFTGYRE